jgi:lactate racemase
LRSIVSLPYGKTDLSLDITNINGKVSLIEPKDVPANVDPLDIVVRSIDKGLDTNGINKLKMAKSIAIAINDKTRPVPNHYLIPPLLQFIRTCQNELVNIRLFIATGTHPSMNVTEMQQLIPTNIPTACVIESHDCDDVSNLEFIGYTKRHTPVWVNKKFYQSDIKIVTGNIEPHHFMGYSGGVKTAAIGLAGRDTITQNHAMITDPKAVMGEYEANPMRNDVEEIGAMIGVDFALNTILNYKKQIVISLFGLPVQVMQNGIQHINKMAAYRSNKLFDVAIASAGGYPKDINLYQAQKALTHASRLVKEGGHIILVAACPEGSGSQTFEECINKAVSVNDIFSDFQNNGFRVGPHKALQIALIAAKKHISLVSELPPDQVKRFFMTPSGSIEEALMSVLDTFRGSAEIAILPHATNILPLIQLS